MLFEFAGLEFRFLGLPPEFEERIRRRFHAESPGTVECKSQSETISVFVETGTFKQIELSALQGPGGEYMPQVSYTDTHILVTGHDFQARISLASRLSGILRVRSLSELDHSIVENVLRVLTAYSVLKQGGLFLHSACAVFDGKAMLFLGRSGAGKTTVSRMALKEGGIILSDDANILLPDLTGGYLVAPVPFSGELGQVSGGAGERIPVHKLFWLDRQAVPGLHAMPIGQQVSRLLSCASIANSDPVKFDLTLNIIEGLLNYLPMKTLSFRKDTPFSVIYDWIHEPEHEIA